MPFSTAKTSMYISPNPPVDGPISLLSHPDMHLPVSFFGNPNLLHDSNLSRYHIAPEDLNHLLRYLIGTTHFRQLTVKGRVFDYTDNYHEYIPMNRKLVYIPPHVPLYDLFSMICPLKARESGRTDLETIKAIQMFLTPDLIRDHIFFTSLNENIYDFVKSNFLYPVAIRRFRGSNRPWIFDFFDVIAAIVNHPQCKCNHYVLRDRQNCTINDLVPIRQGLDTAAYQKYSNVYTLLRSISYDYTRFLQPKRLFIANTQQNGNAFEFVAISQIAFREEYNSNSSLPRLDADHDTWSNDLLFPDLNPQLQCYAHLSTFLETYGNYSFSLQNDDMHIVLDSRLGFLFSNKQSSNNDDRNNYYQFCMTLSTIFMTPLSLFQVPRNHDVIVIPDSATTVINWVPGAVSVQDSIQPNEFLLLKGLSNDYLQRRNRT
jgi:hypothetical protein